MPKKSLDQRLKKFGQKVADQAKHRATEAAQAFNHFAVTHNLHEPREQSREINTFIAEQILEAIKLQEVAALSVKDLETTFNALSKRAVELKNSQEVLAQLEQARQTLALSQGALSALNLVQLSLISRDFVTQANAQCALISNAPKDTASKDKDGKPLLYSQEATEKVATEALITLEALKKTVLEEMSKITPHATYIKTAKETLEKSLKEIQDKILILETVQASQAVAAAPAVASVSADSAVSQALQKQLKEAQDEIARLRAAVGLYPAGRPDPVTMSRMEAQAESARLHAAWPDPVTAFIREESKAVSVAAPVVAAPAPAPAAPVAASAAESVVYVAARVSADPAEERKASGSARP